MSTTLRQPENSVIAPATIPFLMTRLCVLMFLSYAIMGAWVPVFTLHLHDLNFSAEQMAWASATSAIATLFAPLLWGQIADRWLATETCISLCAGATFLLLWSLAQIQAPWLTIILSLLTWMFLIPIFGLTSSFCFRLLELPERDYGKVRLWGTLGWMAASWCLTLWFLWLSWWSPKSPADALPTPNDWSDSLRLGALAALVVALYALTLPHAPPQPRTAEPSGGQSWLLCLIDAPVCALGLFRNRNLVVYSACLFGFYMTMPFTMQLNPLLLRRIGVSANLVPLYLTIAQITEVLFLALLPLLLGWLGTKTTLLIGGGVWTGGLLVLSIGTPQVLVLTALLSHGIFICCFLIAGQVFVNRQATPDIRASAQGLLLFINGLGLLLGHLLVGWIRVLMEDSFQEAYLFAAGVAGSMVVVLLAGFAPVPPPAFSGQEPLVPSSEMP